LQGFWPQNYLIRQAEVKALLAHPLIVISNPFSAFAVEHN